MVDRSMPLSQNKVRGAVRPFFSHWTLVLYVMGAASPCRLAHDRTVWLAWASFVRFDSENPEALRLPREAMCIGPVIRAPPAISPLRAVQRPRGNLSCRGSTPPRAPLAMHRRAPSPNGVGAWLSRPTRAHCMIADAPSQRGHLAPSKPEVDRHSNRENWQHPFITLKSVQHRWARAARVDSHSPASHVLAVRSFRRLVSYLYTAVSYQITGCLPAIPRRI
ncbi:hypothetical protein BD311DRAFT_761699 [Dichomitus squalens]|uniref:Uncharacterized protein n=1 Tax=Dichomitus squalens TaxID=114155 RepID=A0A4Q9ML84_9APHY|nr:hypothetical protein BD311DRAFT_761699 [Dichomitus squalens]